MQPRYFIGITLPEEISIRISRIQHELFLPGKVMDPLVPHITLLDPDSLQTLSPMYFVPKIKTEAERFLPLEIKLTGTGTFHNQVFYISVDGSGIFDLQTHLSSLIPEKVRAQYSIGRNFVPHITLVQAKPKQNLPADLIRKFVSKTTELLPFIFQVDHLSQFTLKSPRQYEVKQI